MSWFSRKSEDQQARELQVQIAKLEDAYNEKSNPAQPEIVEDQGFDAQYTSRYSSSLVGAYKDLEVVNRGVNMIVDGVAEFDIDVKGKIPDIVTNSPYLRASKLNTLINFRANPYISAHELKRQMTMDILLEGNAFLYYDGTYLYNLPAIKVEIIPDKRNFIEVYKYDDRKFNPSEIIHIRDNSADSIFRGASRLSSAIGSINILNNMNSYQNNFFKNNTIMGVVLTTDDMLSAKLKKKKVLEWMRDYNPTTGGRKPLILDAGFKIEPLANYNFKELDFSESIKTQERKILEALGVPPILLDSGNNANISPNTKLLYTNTILPIVKKIVTSFELYFGYDLKPVTSNILALRPELREEANYYSTLANAGILVRNEARVALRYPKDTLDPQLSDHLILPANIAGSAVNSGVGGRPTDSNEE